MKQALENAEIFRQHRSLRRSIRLQRLIRNPIRTIIGRLGLASPPQSWQKRIVSQISLAPLRTTYSQLPSDFFSSWSLDGPSLVWLYRRVVENRLCSILELGSGLSTIAVASALKEFGNTTTATRFVTLEHDERWLVATEEAVEELGLTKFVQIVHAPIIEHKAEACSEWMYDLRAVDGFEFDLIFADGPPPPYGRASVGRYAAPYLKEGGVLVLDDAGRNSEGEAVAAWVLAGLYEFKGFIAVGHGLGLLQKVGDAQLHLY